LTFTIRSGSSLLLRQLPGRLFGEATLIVGRQDLAGDRRRGLDHQAADLAPELGPHARAIATEMHNGFPAVREEWQTGAYHTDEIGVWPSLSPAFAPVGAGLIDGAQVRGYTVSDICRDPCEAVPASKRDPEKTSGGSPVRIVQAADIAPRHVSGHRTGNIEFQQLLQGAPGALDEVREDVELVAREGQRDARGARCDDLER
jgi:hypothetical protein